ncbi:MAG: hypothetical protein ACRDJC_25275 [Thermomicrobiales bacterium]
MRATAIDAITRRAAAGISRRDSFATLGGAGLAAALGAPLVAAAKKSGKRKADKCKKQVGQCRGFFTDVCGAEANCPEVFACCDVLANCNAGEFIECLVAIEF